LSTTLGRARSQGTAARWGDGGGVGNVVACHGGGAPGWVPGTVRVRVADGRPLGFGRGKRPRQERLGPPPDGERLLMSAQAPLTVAQRKRCRAKDTKARRSPIEEPAWVARKVGVGVYNTKVSESTDVGCVIMSVLCAVLCSLRSKLSNIFQLASTKQCRVIQRVRPGCRYRMVQARPSEVTMAYSYSPRRNRLISRNCTSSL